MGSCVVKQGDYVYNDCGVKFSEVLLFSESVILLNIINNVKNYNIEVLSIGLNNIVENK